MRAKWKIPFFEFNFLKYLRKKKKKRVTLLCRRNATIVSSFIGLNAGIYNGKRFKVILITDKMIGHKFGEFVFTRRVSSGIDMHVNKKINKLKKSKKK